MLLSVYKGYYTVSERVCSVWYCTNISAQKIDYVSNSSLDAWGKRRNPQTFEYDNLTELMFDRGFTGHEHLELFDLINMNGRVYDPALGRFLSPDNYVQAPDFSQSFNRYSYCFNNPLKYTDPDGEWVHLVIGAVIGGVSGLITGLNAGAEGGDLWKYIGVGAAAGALSAGIGAGVNSAIAGSSFGAGFIGTATTTSTGFFAGFLTGAASGATNGLITGTGYGLLKGKDFDKAFLDGLTQAGLQGMSSGTVGGVLGGFEAISNDRHFLTGIPRTDKQYIMGNNKITSLTDYSEGKDVTKRHYTSPVANGQDEVTMVFKAPSGYKMTDNFKIWDSGTASAPYSTVLNGNDLTLKFALPSNSLRVGVVITKNFEQNLGQYIHPIQNSSYSWTYWMMSLLHLKQY